MPVVLPILLLIGSATDAQRLAGLQAAVSRLGSSPARIQSLIFNTNQSNGHIDFIVVPLPRDVGFAPEGWEVFADGSASPAPFHER